MSNQQVEMIEETAESLVNNVTGTARKAVLASLGAAAFVQENVKKLLGDVNAYTGKLADKGEVVTSDGRKMVNEFVEPYQEQARKARKDAESRFNNTTETVLNRLNIPSAKSIDDLNKKIASLGRKVDQLKKEEKK